jgi:hypothetical protein
MRWPCGEPCRLHVAEINGRAIHCPPARLAHVIERQKDVSSVNVPVHCIHVEERVKLGAMLRRSRRTVDPIRTAKGGG